jgi:hypothetical protein
MTKLTIIIDRGPDAKADECGEWERGVGLVIRRVNAENPDKE